MIKKITSFLFCLLIVSVFSFSVYADNVKEINIIDRMLEIEKEENLLKDSISDDKNENSYDISGMAMTVFVDKRMYFDKIIMPFTLISVLGIAVLGIVKLRGRLKTSKR